MILAYNQFYPDGVGSWLAKIDTDPAAGGGRRANPGRGVLPAAISGAGGACTRYG